MTLTLISPAFADGDKIPVKYTADGENLSPPLRWSGVPDRTRSFILVVEDSDAPRSSFRHWVVFNIPPDCDHLPESLETGPDALRLKYGPNDFGNARYDGPEPAAGSGPHRYHFRLVALDVPSLSIPRQAPFDVLWKEARKHVLEQAELVGIYER
jgi:Raf kinase inhibitor-like YbhB/YbcL family protein